MDKYTKIMRDLNRSIDNDYKKLSDKYHELELSHNRKKKALILIREYMQKYISLAKQEEMTMEVLYDLWIYNHVVGLCDSALFCDGRERNNGKGVKNG